MDFSEPPKRGGGEGVHTHTHNTLGLRVDESMCVSHIKEGSQYKILGAGETRGEDVACGQLRGFSADLVKSVVLSQPSSSLETICITIVNADLHIRQEYDRPTT